MEQGVFTKSFGVHSTESYQNTWLANLTGADTAMSRMIGVLDDAANSNFWYDLDGKQYYWHDTGDQAAGSLESVDMFVDFTHGGATSAAHSQWGMWNDNVLAGSEYMRLGDESVGLSVFAQFSCETLKVDSNTWARWDSVFAGGLRAALGSHDIFNWGTAEYDVGKTFAQYLNAGNTLTTSWVAGWI